MIIKCPKCESTKILYVCLVNPFVGSLPNYGQVRAYSCKNCQEEFNVLTHVNDYKYQYV